MSNDAQEGKPSGDRRSFLTALTVGLGGIISGLAGIPVLGLVLSPLVKRPPEVWRSVGSISQFHVGDTVKAVIEDPSPEEWAGRSARSAVWLRRETELEFTAFSVNCTHLGCPVRWFQDAELFMCPCHGGVFDHRGEVAAGPPEHPLRRHQVRIRGGEVQIRTGPIPV